MADIKWSAFPDAGAITSGDETVGLRAGANVRLTANQFDNLNLDTNTISSTDTNGDINLDPDGTGLVVIQGSTGIDAVIDDDTMATASATNVPTAESVVAYHAATPGAAAGSTNDIQYNNAGALGAVTTGNDGVLITSGAGVPSISSTLPSGIAATNMSLTTPALGTPSAGVMTNVTGLPLTTGTTGVLPVAKGGTNLSSTTANQLLYSSATDTIAGLATANDGTLITSGAGVPSISSTLPSAVQNNITALGTIGEDFVCTGSGTFSETSGIIGTTTNNSADTGSVGEYREAFRGGFSALPLTSGASADIASVDLTAGDWDIWGNVAFQVNSGVTVLQTGSAGLSTASGTLPGVANRIGFDFGTTGIVPKTNQGNSFNVKGLRLLISSTTTVYLVASADFTTSTCSGIGGLVARRRR